MITTKKKRRGPIVVMFVFQIALVLWVYRAAAGNARPQVRPAVLPSETEGGLANCRYGVATLSPDQVEWLDDLGAGWYLSFGPTMPAAPNWAEFAPVIGISQDKTPEGTYLPTYSVNPSLTPGALGNLVNSRPGSLWIIGNEVDRGPDPGQIEGGQGDTFPEIYAQAYHDVYYFIKDRDPTAQIAVSALVQVTPGRIQYMDLMWDAYKTRYGATMPVDVWNMHLYILPEVNPSGQPNAVANVALGTDPALGRMESGGNPNLCPLTEIYCVAEHDDLDVFAEQVIAMRTWMRDHGQRNKPLILSEFSILYPNIDDGDTCWLQDEFGNCFTPQRVTNFLNNSFTYLESAVDPNLGYPKDGNRLIQQWLWFSMNNQDGVGNVSDLIRGIYLTQVGQAYQTRVLAQQTSINLLADGATNPTANTGGNGTANVKLTVTVRNNGNVAPPGNFYVTFYKDAGMTQPIGTATVTGPGPNSAGMTGCARLAVQASVTWSNLAPGVHRYWAKVDSTNAVIETSESDNFAAGIVFINGNHAYFPITRR